MKKLENIEGKAKRNLKRLIFGGLVCLAPAASDGCSRFAKNEDVYNGKIEARHAEVKYETEQDTRYQV